MVIEYSSSPEYEKRQPAATTLTDAQAVELNNRQAFLLPEVNVGQISGEIKVESRMGGTVASGARMGGKTEIKARMGGTVRAY